MKYKKLKVRRNNGWWVNTSVFSEEANFFTKHGYYTNHTWGSIGWINYWKEQLRRCIEGYEVSGEKITGHHYFYLNFVRLQVEYINPRTKKRDKREGFPSFRDGDYDFFWSFEIANNGIDKKTLKRLKLKVKIHEDYLDGGHNIVVAKKRRSGYSEKAAAIAANIYNTIRNSEVIIGAANKKLMKDGGIMTKVLKNINFLNEHTGWRKSRDVKNTNEYLKASYLEVPSTGGTPVEKGYKSSILSVTFNDDADAARGKEAKMIALDEAGSFKNLMESYLATQPSVMTGDYQFGTIIIFGTGSKMEGSSVDFEDMFNDPITYKALPFYNVWDEGAENNLCGFFHPAYMNKEGYTDENGNSLVKEAIKSESDIREKKRKGKNSNSYFSHMMEYPIYTTDVFSSTQSAIFNVADLRARLNLVKREGLQEQAEVVELTEKDGKIIIVPNSSLTPLFKRKPPSTENLDGAVIIYERPVKSAPPNSYSIGFDPYNQDKTTGVSIASIIVRKKYIMGEYSYNKIVARYRGRPDDADKVNKIFYQLCKLYNSQGMYENMFRHVKTYFSYNKHLNWLASQPDLVISKHIKDSKVERIYGIHMTEELKDAGETYIKNNLNKVINYKYIDDTEIPIRVIDLIDDIPMLEDLIAYTRKGNHDDVMAYMMCMFQEEETKILSTDTDMDDISGQLLELMNNQYK